MSRPIRAFLSSTWQDLQPEREATEHALNRLRDTLFNGMEYFGSRPEAPREVSLAEVDRSDVYIGIFAHRYGSGITEAEYQRAWERGTPCLIYFKDASVPVRPADVERDAAQVDRLETLKRVLRERHTISSFKNPDQLAAQVVTDLHNHLRGVLEPTSAVPSVIPPLASDGEPTPPPTGDQVRARPLAATSGPVGPTAADAMRLGHLEDNIGQDLVLLKEYEDALRYEDEPRRRARYRREIEHLRASATAFRLELEALRERPGGASSQASARVATQLDEMDQKLDALLSGQSSRRAGVADLRVAVLDRFDTTERAIVSTLVQRLDDTQAAATQQILDALDAERVSAAELDQALIAIRAALTEVQQSDVRIGGASLRDPGERLLTIVDAPRLDVKHKLKVTLPIIPLILAYEGEVELKSGANLANAWRRLIGKAREEL